MASGTRLRLIGCMLFVHGALLSCQDEDTAPVSPVPVNLGGMANSVPELNFAPPLSDCAGVRCAASELCQEGVCMARPRDEDSTSAEGGVLSDDEAAGGHEPVGGHESVGGHEAAFGFDGGTTGTPWPGGDIHLHPDALVGGSWVQMSEGSSSGVPFGGAQGDNPTEHNGDDGPDHAGAPGVTVEEIDLSQPTTEDSAIGGSNASEQSDMEAPADASGGQFNGGQDMLPSYDELCSDVCVLSGDDTCQDGGPDSLSAFCPYGTDCGDCGARSPGNYCPGHNRNCTCDDGRTAWDVPPRPSGSCTPYSDESDCERPANQNPACQPCMDASECQSWGPGYICHHGACSPPRCSDETDCAQGPCSPDGYCDGIEPSTDTEDSVDEGTGADDSPMTGGVEMLEPNLDMPEPVQGPNLCSEQCPLARNGLCDDGGPGAISDLCRFGSDCGDCGVRPTPSERWVCVNGCADVPNGVCEDGGPNAVTNDCALGADCADCGVRAAPDELFFCAHLCYTFEDIGSLLISVDRIANGLCEDGGPGSDLSLCNLGTDCIDCGPR